MWHRGGKNFLFCDYHAEWEAGGGLRAQAAGTDRQGTCEDRADPAATPGDWPVPVPPCCEHGLTAAGRRLAVGSALPPMNHKAPGVVIYSVPSAVAVIVGRQSAFPVVHCC